VSREVIDLIHKMSLANPRWGAPRIHGELLKLGFELSQATVAKYIVRYRKLPSQTWHTFLQNRMKDFVAADFFVAPTAFFKVLFVFVILSHDRRRLVHFAVSEHPTAEWWRGSSWKPSPGTPLRATCCATEMAAMEQTFVKRRSDWTFRKFSRHRNHSGRMPTSSA
jgi:hypothetical protein